MPCTLTINDCELFVKLGWTEEERQHPQYVTVTIALSFLNPLKATTTDQLQDTVCYRTLIQHLRSHTATRSYALLEYLGQELLNNTQHFLQTLSLPPHHIALIVTKWPCIAGLPNGVSFSCETSSHT